MKEERNEQTPTIYNSLKGLEKYICVRTPSFSSLEKYSFPCTGTEKEL